MWKSMKEYQDDLKMPKGVKTLWGEPVGGMKYKWLWKRLKDADKGEVIGEIIKNGEWISDKTWYGNCVVICLLNVV